MSDLTRCQKSSAWENVNFKNEPVDKKVYEDLMDRNGLISREYMIVQYLLFSKSGFSEWVRENTDPSLVKK